jgi:opacity protein-like surface antigen
MTKLLASCALAILVFAVAPQALQAADAQCPLQNATKHGTYVVAGAGTIVDVGPATVVGEITYDGQGNTVATYTVSVNGTIHRGVTVTGTYTVNPDCTGSSSESDGTHYDFVTARDGNTTTWIETDTGTVISGTEVRLSRDRSPVED